MNTYEKIKKWLKNIIDRDHLGFTYYPWRDWQLLVIIFLILEVIVFSSHYVFYQWSAATKDQAVSKDDNQNMTEIRNKLDQISFYYQNKQKELEQAKQNP